MQSSDPGFREVRPAGGGPLIRIADAALTDLRVAVRESVKALRGIGVEVGGVVFGEPLDGAGREIVITGFVPVKIEYRSGPTYRPSRADLPAFQQAIEDSEQTAIGYFRSQTQGGFNIRQEDSVLAQLFPATDSCLVGVEASAQAPVVVHLHKVRAGGVPVLVQSFELDAAPDQRIGDTPPLNHEAPAPTPPAAVAPVPAPAERNWQGLVWALGGTVVVLALAIAYLAGRQSAPAGSPVAEQAARPVAAKTGYTGLDLHAIERDGQLEIRWDPASVAVQTAARGALMFTGSRPIELKAAELRSGSYSWKLNEDSVAFALMIYQTDGKVSGESETFVKGLGSSAPYEIGPNGVTPSDTDFPRSQQLISDKRKLDPPAVQKGPEPAPRNRQVDELRIQIPHLIEAKRWDEAEKRITDLQLAVPNDPEASTWRRTLINLRISQLMDNVLAEPALHTAPVSPVQAAAQPQPQAQTPAPAQIQTPPQTQAQTASQPAPQPSSQPTQAAPQPQPQAPVAAARPPEQTVAILRRPPVTPLPVETAIPLPSTLNLPAPSPSISVRPVPETQLSALLRRISGQWTFSNPKARRPRVINGFQFAPETVLVDVNPDGSGFLDYEIKPGIWHVAETGVQFRFRVTGWDGVFLSGSSDGDPGYAVTLQPGSADMHVVWHAKNPGGKLHINEGEAKLTRGPQPAAAQPNRSAPAPNRQP